MPETTTVEEPSLLNQPLEKAPEEKQPEETLFPEQKEKEVKVPEVKTPETKPEEKKEEPKEEPKTPSTEVKTTPVDYDTLKLPEGSLLSQEELVSIKKEAKEQGLTAEEVQGVLEVKNDAVRAFQARQIDALAKAKEEWKQAWLNDPDYGGEKSAASTELAKRAWDKIADNELKALADQAGFGNHPAVLRAMARLGKWFAEDTLKRGTLGGVTKQKSPEEVLYGGTTTNNDEPMS